MGVEGAREMVLIFSRSEGSFDLDARMDLGMEWQSA